MMQRIEYKVLQQLLVRNTDFDRLSRRAMLSIPVLDQWDVKGTPGSAGSHVKRPRRPQERNAVGRVVCVGWTIQEERLNVFRKFKLFVVIGKKICLRIGDGVTMRDRIDQRIEVKGGQIGILGLDEDNVRRVIPRKVNVVWQIVVQIWECDPILCSDRLTNNDLVDVIELIPVILKRCGILDQRFVFGSSGDGNVKGLGREKGLQVEQVKVVVVNQVSHQLKDRQVIDC